MNKMQKIVNGLAIFSSLISLTVVGAGGYVYLEKDNIIEGVKSQVAGAAAEAISGALPGMMDSAMPELPGATGGAIPSTPGTSGGIGGGTPGLPF